MWWFWTVLAALLTLVVLVLVEIMAAPPGGTGWAVSLGMAACVAVVGAGLLRAAAHVAGRADLTGDDKRVWLLWFWLGAPVTVPLYLRRARL